MPCGPLKGGLHRAAPALCHQTFPRKVQSQRKKSASTSAVFDLYNTAAIPHSPCSYYSLVRFIAALGLLWKEREASGDPTRASTHKNVCFKETFGIFFLFLEPIQRNLPCPFPQEHGSEVTTSWFFNSAWIHGLCSYHWAGHKSSPTTCTQNQHSFSSCHNCSLSLGDFPANSQLGRTSLSSLRPPGSSRAFHVVRNEAHASDHVSDNWVFFFNLF